MGSQSVIVIDTHIWFWWVQGLPQLSAQRVEILDNHAGDGLVLSDISMWELAMAVTRGRIVLPMPIAEWMNLALAYPNLRVVAVTPKIAIESTQLPGSFHRDPADQLIVATARVLDCPLMTSDEKILAYKHVKLC